MNYMLDMLTRARAANIAAGLCPDCGGSGIVADLSKIERTGDPHANRRCGRCKGTGKPRQKGKADQKAIPWLK